MKIFSEEQTNKRFKFRGVLAFKTINNEVLKSEQNNSEQSHLLNKDSALHENCLPSIKIDQNDNFGMSFEPFAGQCINGNKNTENRKKTKYIRLNARHIKNNKKTQYNIGRWTEDEHRRFIEAILKHGNEWKAVQRHIKSRSSTQSRSHSQKFFLKIKNYDIFDFKDRKPCISSLNEIAKKLSDKDREDMLELLISYEYCDIPESNKLIAPEKLLTKKRKYENNNSLEFDMDDELLNLTFSSNAFAMTNTNTVSLSNLPSRSEIKEEKRDEFQDNFQKAFLTSRIRRHSFEDNIFLLYADAFLDKSNMRRRSVSKNKRRDTKEDNYLDSLIEFNNDYIVL